MPAKIKLGNRIVEGVLDHQNNMPFIYMVSSNLLKAALMCKIRRGDVIKKLEYQEGDTRKIFLEGTMYIGDLIQQQQYYPIKITLQHTVKPLTLAINHKSQFNTNIYSSQSLFQRIAQSLLLWVVERRKIKFST